MADTAGRRTVQLDDARVLITGGTSGVGLETAIQFLEAGARGVAINGRDAGRGARAVDAVKARVPGAAIHFVQGDANTPEGARALCKAAGEALGGIDVLVNSTVGPAGPTLLKDIPLDEIPQIVAAQMMAPLLTSRAVLPMMTEQGGGAIVNIASDAGKLTTPGESVIGAAMAAIIMFSRTMAIEVKRNNIRVNIVTPSIIEGTETYGKVMSQEFAGKLFGKAIKMAQLGVVTPADMAALIVFLSSPQAARITGQAISCNGGISAA